MFIERIKIDISNRKENIPSLSHKINLDINRYHFEIAKVINDMENKELHLIGLNWLNSNKYEKEEDIIEIIKDNIDLLIYDHLI